MILDEIVYYLDSQSTKLKVGGTTGAGVPIWKGTMPEEQANTSIAIYESGGPPPNYRFGSTAAATKIDHERPGIQVISRSTKYTTARSNAQLVFNLLAPLTNATISPSTALSVKYIKVTPSQSPFDLGKDVVGRDMVSCNFIVDKEVSGS